MRFVHFTALQVVLLSAIPLEAAINVDVFRDYNGSASDDGALEPGVAGLTLTAYNAAGAATVATDNGGGSYTLATSAGTYRIELTGLPSYLQPGATGAGSVATVTFANDGATLAMAVQNPAQHTQSNPRIAVACYEGGTGAGSTGPALVSFPYDSDGIPAAFSPNPPNGTAASPRKDAQIQELGTVWGAAWQASQERLFQSSFLKRHVGFVDGPGHVYVIDYSGASPAVTGSFNLDGITPANGGADIDLGTVTRTSVAGAVTGDNELSDDPTEPSWDLDAFGKVGTISFGDAELTEDGASLWIVNTNQKALIEVDATLATGSFPGSVNQHVISTLPGAPTSSTGQVRPWALKFHDGLGYLGVVLDASTSKLASDLEAIVLSFDPENIASGFTEVLRFDLDYNRENGQTGADTTLEWQFWAATWAEAAPFTNTSDNNYMAPQPVLADIEFTEDGSMVMGMMDRFGHMNGRVNYQAISGNTGLFDTNSGGDLLYACLVGGVFVIEGAPGCPTSDNNAITGDPTDTLRQDDGVSNNGEYFYNDHFEEGSISYTHGETATGALTLLLGTAEVVTTHYDPIQGTTTPDTVTNTQGVVWHDTLLGTRAQIGGGEHSYMLVPRSPVDSSGFAKSNGLGDLELLLAPAPIEIGDYVWYDLDTDGVQDPGETGFSGVTVRLHDLDAGGALVGMAVTDSNGGYLFGGAGDINMTSGAVLSNRNYELRISLGDVNLGGTVPTIRTGGTALNNSDGVQFSSFAVLPFLTGDAGANDHTLDFGFADPVVGVGNLVFRDFEGDGIFNNADVGVEAVTVEIYASTQTPGVDPPLATTRTDPSGCYLFELPAVGDYILHLPAGEFQSGGPLFGLTSSTGAGGDGVTDDDGDEDGIDTLDAPATGVTSSVFTLAESGMPTNEPGKGPRYSGALADSAVNETLDFGLRTAKATDYNSYISGAGLTPGTPAGQPVADASGAGGNPDGDFHDNLLEHALCDTPNSGVPNHFGFCVELANPATGQVDASFIRPEAIQDVIYTLVGYDSLGGIPITLATIAAGANAAPPFTVAINGDGTETVTYADIRNASGYAGADFGLVRLCVSLDSEPDGTPDTVILPSDGSSVEATSCTKSFGWQCTDYNATECASCSHPFSNKPVFTGTVDGNTGVLVSVSTAANGADLSIAIPGGGTHYLQITSGPLEGERFDIASAGVDAMTLVSDPGIFAALDGVESLNTSEGALANDAILGATIQVLPHRTLDQLFDKNGAFAGLASGSTSDAAKVLLYNNRLESPAFENYLLVDTGSEVKWVRSNDLATLTDQGAHRIDRAEGAYMHPILGGLTHCTVGMVADHDVAVALNEGYNLTGAPYPIDQAPADADPGAPVDGRDMQVSTGFFGGVTPRSSAQLLFWTGDMAVDDGMTYMAGYTSLMLLDGGGMERWINANDPAINDVGGQLLLESHRAATVKLPTGNTLKPHFYPVP